MTVTNSRPASAGDKQRMQPFLTRDFGVKRDDEQIVLARRDGTAVDLPQNLNPLPMLGDPRSADECRPHRPAFDTRHLNFSLKRPHLASERVALADPITDAEVGA